MSKETVGIHFGYEVGEIVLYDGGSWKVEARRCQEGMVSRFITYGLVPEPPYGAPFQPALTWAYEPDIQESTP